MPRKYDQDADGNRVCPHCQRVYKRGYISRHAAACGGHTATTRGTTNGDIIRAARQLARLMRSAYPVARRAP